MRYRIHPCDVHGQRCDRVRLRRHDRCRERRIADFLGAPPKKHPASTSDDLKPSNDGTTVSYMMRDGLVAAILELRQADGSPSCAANPRNKPPQPAAAFIVEVLPCRLWALSDLTGNVPRADISGPGPDLGRRLAQVVRTGHFSPVFSGHIG